MANQVDFKHFLHNIEPSKTAKSETRRIQINIRNFLKNNERFKNLYNDSFLSGSYAKNTAIRKPKYASNGDVDIIVALSCSVDANSIDVFNNLFEVLKSSKRYSNIRRQHHSIRVEMRGIDVDIVPAIKDPKSGKYYIGSSKENSWIISDPKGHLAWASEMNSDTNHAFKPLVKMFKWWRLKNCPKNVKFPKGITLEKIVADNCRVDSSNIGDIFIDTLGTIATNYSGSDNKPFICDPCIPKNNLLESYTDDDFNTFIQKAAKHYKMMTNGDTCWAQIFGDEFANSASQNASDTEEFIEDKFEIRPTYRIRLDGVVSQKGFRPFWLTHRKVPLLHGLKIEFKILEITAPKPYDVYWKIRNVGEEAERRNCIRGQIVRTNLSEHIEYSQFDGPHFVECYIVKNNVCVAMARIAVPIKQSDGDS